MIHLKYRPDIDGLRAVAVLGVVIYHAFPWVIPGGFIGVDIFFVISGYLISGILYKGHNAGNFSFKEFYARRIRRLFPALITMLVITMAYGWVILLPDEFEQLGKHVAAGTLFIQNFVFWQESGYFDTAASLKPLLHLWSLAVEEQFYIFFPPILLLIWKRKWPLAAIMGVLLVISMVCNLWASAHSGTADFFLTPYRAWELLGGSLLAWWHEERVKKLGGVARGQGILDGKAPASENPPAGFDRAGNTARRGPLSSPEGLGGFSSWPALDQAGQARCGDCHSPPSLAKLENPLQRNSSEFLHTLLDRGHEEDEPLYREALSWIGVTLLALGFAFIRTGDPYPGWRAILPVAGTLLLMEGGAGGIKGAWVNKKILSNPGVVWIGLISYPLYLFHWPALSFVHIVKGDSPKPVYLLDALIIALILTVLTYYFIERKLRHNKSKYTLSLLVAAFIMTGGIGFLVSNNNFGSHYNPGYQSEFKKAATDADMLGGWKKVKNHGLFSINTTGGGGPQTLFLGDSNMQQYGPRILELLKENQADARGAILITECGVPPIAKTISSEGKNSSELMTSFNKELESNSKIDRVVIASRWCSYFSKNTKWKTDEVSLETSAGKQEAMQELDACLRSIQKHGAKIFLVLNIPTGSALDPKGIYPRNFTGTAGSKKKILTKEEFLRDNGEILSEIASIARKNGAEVIDPLDYLCTNGVCIAEDENGVPIRFDDGHLCPAYVRDHVKYLDRSVEH